MIADRPLRVLESFQTPRATTNPYIVMLYQALQGTDGVSVQPFSWRRALVDSFDVFHVHWPEVRLDGRTWAARTARHLLMAALLIKLWLTRTPIVRTKHNLSRPSGIGWASNALLAWLERQTSHTIVLTAQGQDATDPTVTVIPHGHYRDWFARYPAEPAQPGRFAFFGLVRQYKGLTRLVQQFRDLDDDYSLVIAGNPSRDQLVDELTAATDADHRITLDFRFLPDADLVRVATSGQVVVLPYREMHNSGGVLAALSLDRPVLVPRNPVLDELAAEVGERWVLRYSGELTTEDLRRSIQAADALTHGDRPDLSARDWADCGAQHRAAFAAALDRLRGR